MVSPYSWAARYADQQSNRRSEAEQRRHQTLMQSFQEQLLRDRAEFMQPLEMQQFAQQLAMREAMGDRTAARDAEIQRRYREFSEELSRDTARMGLARSSSNNNVGGIPAVETDEAGNQTMVVNGTIYRRENGRWVPAGSVHPQGNNDGE